MGKPVAKAVSRIDRQLPVDRSPPANSRHGFRAREIFFKAGWFAQSCPRNRPINAGGTSVNAGFRADHTLVIAFFASQSQAGPYLQGSRATRPASPAGSAFPRRSGGRPRCGKGVVRDELTAPTLFTRSVS